jgi:hypothetical protein
VQIIGYFIIVWLAIMAAGVACLFPGLALVFAGYLAASLYLGLVIASPVILVCLFAFLFLWLRKWWKASCP